MIMDIITIPYAGIIQIRLAGIISAVPNFRHNTPVVTLTNAKVYSGSSLQNAAPLFRKIFYDSYTRRATLYMAKPDYL